MSASRRRSAGRSIVPPDRPPSSYAVLTRRHPSPAWLLMNASHASRCACSELKSCSSPSSDDFRQTAPELILCAVRWYLRYSLSLRDVEELFAERGLEADHTTVWRWVDRK